MHNMHAVVWVEVNLVNKTSAVELFYTVHKKNILFLVLQTLLQLWGQDSCGFHSKYVSDIS